jgi:hypothetical protein
MLGVRGGVRLKQWGKGRTSASSYTGSKRSASRSRRLQGTIASCATVSRSGSRTGCPSCCPSPRTRSAGAERQSLSCVSSASTSSETLVATARRRRHTASAVAPRVSAPTEPARRGRRDLSYWWSSECVCVCVCVCVSGPRARPGTHRTWSRSGAHDGDVEVAVRDAVTERWLAGISAPRGRRTRGPSGRRASGGASSRRPTQPLPPAQSSTQRRASPIPCTRPNGRIHGPTPRTKACGRWS